MQSGAESGLTTQPADPRVSREDHVVLLFMHLTQHSESRGEMQAEGSRN